MTEVKHSDGPVASTIRNIAIIAHVDHGKTTLVDAMMRQSGLFRENEAVVDRMMDTMDLERERGITIMAKNAAVHYRDVKINILDTPGHSDFGGEVERVLKLVDGVMLLVDAAEGPLPQTRYVLSKAFEAHLPPIVVINKIDRHEAEPERVLDEIYDLFIDLDATEEQLNFPVLYTVGRQGIARRSLDDPSQDLRPLYEEILRSVPAPPVDVDAPLQLLIANLDYNDYVGRLGIGRIVRGRIHAGETVALCKADGEVSRVKVAHVYVFDGLKRVATELAEAGDVIAIAGIAEVNIGDTIASVENPEPLPRIRVDEPTISMEFSVNNSPFAGREGKFVTSRNLRERLFRELLGNVSIRVEETDSPDTFRVTGRGVLQLGILIEMMRREGYELQVAQPEVVTQTVDGHLMEPIEQVFIDVPETFVGVTTESLGRRKGVMSRMINHGAGRVRMEFEIPSRGLIGFRSEFLSATKGTGLFNTLFDRFDKWQGTLPGRLSGALVADREGLTTPFALYNLQERGMMFFPPSTPVYEGMVVGENCRWDDLNVNVCKEKKLTNMRESTKEDTVKLVPPHTMSLDECLEFIDSTELVEVTPKSIRIRKKTLPQHLRLREISREKTERG